MLPTPWTSRTRPHVGPPGCTGQDVGSCQGLGKAPLPSPSPVGGHSCPGATRSAQLLADKLSETNPGHRQGAEWSESSVSLSLFSTLAGGQASGCIFTPSLTYLSIPMSSASSSHHCQAWHLHFWGSGLPQLPWGQLGMDYSHHLPTHVWTVCPSSLSGGDSSSRNPSRTSLR